MTTGTGPKVIADPAVLAAVAALILRLRREARR